MLFDDAFIESLKSDPLRGALKACLTVRGRFVEEESWREEELAALSELLALLVEMDSAGLLPFHLDYPELSGNLAEDCGAIVAVMNEAQDALTAEVSKAHNETTRARFRLALGKQFAYEFSQGDLHRVQELLNELRDQVAAADYFEADHKARVLARLEKLQAEVHKKISSLDRFWGLIGDAGVAAGKFGTDAKPIVDRVRELTQIVWRTQARAEELPSDAAIPSLENNPTDPAIET